jgi:hypothetical protein
MSRLAQQSQRIHGHLVNAKVSRLGRPALDIVDSSIPGKTSEPRLPTSTLTLPGFGNVYVGETFACVISVNSAATDATVKIKVTADMQAPNSRVPIPLIHDALTTDLDPSGSWQHVLRYETVAPGEYTLSVTVTYVVSDEKPTTFKKTYRFNTKPALYVTTKVSGYRPGAYTVEAQIENVSDSAMVFETAEIVPDPAWTVEAFSPLTNFPIQPADIWQCAFIVSAVRDQSTSIGNLTLGWRREPLGEKGWTTGPIKL